MIVLILEQSQSSNAQSLVGSMSCHTSLQHGRLDSAGGIAMENQSRESNTIPLATIVAVLKHQLRIHEKESKSPWVFKKSRIKDLQYGAGFVALCSPVIKSAIQPRG